MSQVRRIASFFVRTYLAFFLNLEVRHGLAERLQAPVLEIPDFCTRRSIGLGGVNIRRVGKTEGQQK